MGYALELLQIEPGISRPGGYSGGVLLNGAESCGPALVGLRARRCWRTAFGEVSVLRIGGLRKNAWRTAANRNRGRYGYDT